MFQKFLTVPSSVSHVLRRPFVALCKAWQCRGSSCLIPRCSSHGVHNAGLRVHRVVVCNAPQSPVAHTRTCMGYRVFLVDEPANSYGETKGCRAPPFPRGPLPTYESRRVPPRVCPPFLKDASYFIVPEQCFSLALPEFHLLCASGAVGDDRRALDGALSKLSSVSDRGCLCVRV